MATRRSIIRVSGIVFVLTFLAGLLLLGEALGAFGDPDQVFTDYYVNDHEGDLLGTASLIVAAGAFCVFAVFLTATESRNTSRTLLTIALACFAVSVLAAAACLATVPAARAFGGAFGDDGQATSAHWLLPQLGYVLLFGGAAISAACALLLMTLGGSAPSLPAAVRWSGAATGVLLFAVLLFMPMLLLPLWVLVASIWHGVSSDE